MNLPEYFTMVLDELEAKYISCLAVYEGFQHQRDSRDEALQRLKEIVALRKVLKIHNTCKVAFSWPNDNEAFCVGCGTDSFAELVTPNVNDCPVLLALVEPYSDRADFESWN